MERPDYEKVRKIYGWIAPEQPEDAWHARSSRVIDAEVGRAIGPGTGGTILNLGCGGFHYGLPTSRTVCVDVTPVARSGCGLAVEGDAERLPIRDSSVESVVCVGSVLNYTDAPRCLAELARVIAPGGTLILEFERSESATYWGRRGYRQWVWQVPTQYKGHAHNFWIYSEAWVRGQLRKHGFEIIKERHFHIAGALAARLVGLSPLAAAFSSMDHLVKRIRACRDRSANVLLVCRRP